MPTANIDQNDTGTLLAQNDTTGLTERLRVDPVLDALEVFVVANDALTPTALNHAKIDANDKATLLAFNETSGLVEALRCSSDGVLKVITV